MAQAGSRGDCGLDRGTVRETMASACARGDGGAGAKSCGKHIGETLVNHLDYVGVLAVELFDTADGLIINEIAPRVHNSGHVTADACAVGQFEQHIRAICGWPLGDPQAHSQGEMTNILGHEIDNWAGFAADANTRLHLYGKPVAREGRKMGHITRLTPF